MNIDNIAALAAQLQALGFQNFSGVLLKRICFRPDSFILTQKLLKGSDKFNFHLFYEGDARKTIYSLKYYDATLQKETVLADTSLDGINLVELESSMAEIDWKIAFELDTKQQWSPADKSSWEKELKVASVVDRLQQLDSSEQGKQIASILKLKYWTGMPYEEMAGTISPIKNKSDVSQRFYLSDGNDDISMEEAIRFLQNRWLEKQMHLKRKQTDDPLPAGTENEGNASSPAGLLQKNKLKVSRATRKYNKVRS